MRPGPGGRATHGQITAAIERAVRALEKATRENEWRFVVVERDGYGGEEVSVVSDAWYQETCREEDCVAALWSYRDEAGVMRAAREEFHGV